MDRANSNEYEEQKPEAPERMDSGCSTACQSFSPRGVNMLN